MSDWINRKARVRARRVHEAMSLAPADSQAAQSEPGVAPRLPQERAQPPRVGEATSHAAQPSLGHAQAYQAYTAPGTPAPRPPTTRDSAEQAPPARAAKPRQQPDALHTAPPSYTHDALESDAILELPVQRRVASAARTAPRATSGGARSEGARQQPPAELPTTTSATPYVTPNAARLPLVVASRASAEQRPPVLTPLGDALQEFAAHLSARRRSAGADGGAPVVRSASLANVCPHCHGAGYLRLEVPVGDPFFGQAVPCHCKEQEREERERGELRRLSNLDPFAKMTFESFDTSLPATREAYEVARRYAEDPHGWLIFQGSYGVGKTHLAAAIANHHLAAGNTVFFNTVPELLDHLRTTFAPSSETTYDALFDKIREAGLLVLDDLGSENATAWATEKLFQLINYRYNYGMPMVVTTNYKLLSRLDERIRSRLADVSLARHVVIEGQSYRERHIAKGARGGRPAMPPERPDRDDGPTGRPPSPRTYRR